jgi:hypothetical protein
MNRQRRQKQLPANDCEIFDNNGVSLCSSLSASCGKSRRDGMGGKVYCEIDPGYPAKTAGELNLLGLKNGDACVTFIDGPLLGRNKFNGTFTAVGDGDGYKCLPN